jgi:hypothetical protein
MVSLAWGQKNGIRNTVEQKQSQGRIAEAERCSHNTGERERERD